MRYFCNLSDCKADPVEWATARHTEGWDGVLVADHLFDDWGSRPNVWATLGALAVSNPGLRIGTGYANNLVRHPVEFAQASLTLQRISGGRFEAGLGAGWSEDELARTGRTLPAPGERAGMLIEAVQLVSELFRSGRSAFSGDHYDVDVPRLERLGDLPPPQLVVGAGGPRVIRSVAPYVDKLELMPAAVGTRTGAMNMDLTNRVGEADVRKMIDVALSARAELPLRMYVPCCAGDDERTARIAAMYGGFFAAFQGSPRRVADAILSLGELGIGEIHLATSDTYTYANLAPLLVEKEGH